MLHVVSVQYANVLLMVFGASVMQCTNVSQFSRLGYVLYVTALEAYWCTEALAALLLSFGKGFDELLSMLRPKFCHISYSHTILLSSP